MTTEYAASLVNTNIEDEMRSSYLDYSMSVIVGRALPSVRDGLKPVHRRILYAMFRMGMLHNRKYTKCAGVVGEVLKLYHPHGDSAVYDALVRMAQPWNLRYPLIDGQGNFGNIDGDSAAAYRYTESRMHRIAEDLLSDIDKETVDFVENFDGSTTEPVVLPTRVPNLLINGSAGIAVGMATNVAPHNLGEVVAGTVALIDDPDLDEEALLKIIPGPDFPTGGVIYGTRGPREAALEGRGRIKVRGVAEFETDENGDATAIVITEIPYQVNKSRLVESIAALVRQKKIEGIREIRDESDRQGMRIYIELKRDAVGQIVLNQLYKQTALQTTFGAINLALVDGRPEVLPVRRILLEFIGHRKEVVVRRSRFELAQAEARAHILEGYLKALDVIDEIIAIIRSSPDTDVARGRLIETFDFTHVQAQAILDMRLARLTALERDKLQAEYDEVKQRIDYLQQVLGSEQMVLDIIKEELKEIGDRYGDARRTRIVEDTGELSIEDLILDEDVVVTFSHLGYVKRTPVREYDAQRRGGTGKRGMATREEDFVRDLFVARTHDQLMVFTTQGRVYLLPVYEVPEGGRAARGRPMVNLLPLQPEERVATVLDIREFDERSLVMVSRQGNIKRTNLIDYKNIRANGIIACGLNDGDELLTVRLLDDPEGTVLLATAQGKSIHFPAHEAREMGRSARGVRGVTLVGDDALVGIEIVKQELTLLTITRNGYGKRTPIAEYRAQHRGGIGLIDIITRDRNGPVIGVAQVDDGDQVMLVTSGGKVIRISVEEVRIIGRNTMGVRLIRLDDDEEVVAMAVLRDADEDDGRKEAVPIDEDFVEEAIEPEAEDDGALDEDGGAPPDDEPEDDEA